MFPPGQPTVERAGPLLLALETKTMLCLSQSKENCSSTALWCVCVVRGKCRGSGERNPLKWEEGHPVFLSLTIAEVDHVHLTLHSGYGLTEKTCD